MESLRFTMDGVHNRVVAGWRGNKRNWRTNARNHALTHGHAGVWRADESFILYYRDGDTVRQKTWPRALPLQFHVAPIAR